MKRHSLLAEQRNVRAGAARMLAPVGASRAGVPNFAPRGRLARQVDARGPHLEIKLMTTTTPNSDAMVLDLAKLLVESRAQANGKPLQKVDAVDLASLEAAYAMCAPMRKIEEGLAANAARLAALYSRDLAPRSRAIN